MLSLDFETYYDADISLTKLSPEAYLKSLFDCGKPPYLISLFSKQLSYSGPLANAPWSLFEKYEDNKTIVCHNARFDKAVFKACAAKGLVPKEWLGSTWLCTADMSVYHQAPRSLAGASKTILGEGVSKDPRKSMKGLMFDSLSHDRQEEMRKYCMRDSELCFRLAEALLPSWPAEEREISCLNREIGMYGVKLDEDYIAKSLQKLKQIMFDAEKKLPWREDPNADTATLSPKAVAKLCGEAGIPMPHRLDDGVEKVTWAQNEPEVAKWETEYGKKYPWVAAMRDYRKANILLKKLQTMQRHSVDGILYFSLKYFGAHTGRFSGEGGWNPQNLPGRKESFVSLRHAIVARPGKELCIVDWCQIEPRLLRWAVGDKEALALLEQGISIYEAYAIQHFGWKGTKLKVMNPALYGLAKAAVLGAGYGCGSRKYQGVAKAMAGIDLTEQEAERQVALYRQGNPNIVSLWNRFNSAAKLSAMRHQNFSITLPTGRKLMYFKPTLVNGLTASPIRDLSKVSFLHGGLLTENYIQAVARDVFALGMARLARANVQNLFHVHDEYVLEVDEGNRKGAEQEIRAILLAPIPWLPGCPLDVEIKWRSRYG